MNNWLIILSLTLTTLTLLSLIWLIVPAPLYNVWLFSVAASEWSLWFGLVALGGVILAILHRLINSSGNLWIISLIFGGGALLISLYPYFSSVKPSRQGNVSLSFVKYFFGAFAAENSSAANFETYSFAQIGENDLKLDVYLPSAQNANNGASVVVVHGGLWNRGARSDFPQWNEWLARQGFTVFDVDYRLAPQPNYATATGDVKCAVKWIKNHHADFKISADRIALLGRSAGGQLALLAAYSAGDRQLPAACGDSNVDEGVRAVISFYAPTDLNWGFDHPANQSVIDGPAALNDFIGGNPHESADIAERFKLASPVAHVSPQTPPTLLFHGGQDQLVSSKNMGFLAAKLELSHVIFRQFYIPYGQHGFDYNFNGWGSQIAESAITGFLREHTTVR